MTATPRTAGWTLTFYAYKGGTGRTLALANVARYMAEVLGYRVGVVDLDIESPGLAHEPLCPLLEPDNPAAREEQLQRLDLHPGFIDLFTDQLGAHCGPLDVAPSDLDRYVVALDGDGNGGGSVILMPTGKGSVYKGVEYQATLEAFLRLLTNTAADTVGNLTHSLLQAFIRRYDLDFLFLDGRTGTGSFFPVYAYAVPQALLLFFGLNDQNVSGSLSMLQAQTEIAVDEAPVLLVASPVPTVGPTMLESRLVVVDRELDKLRKQRELQKQRSGDAGKRYIYELPRSVSFMLPYSDLATYEEAYFPRSFPHSQLAREYRRIAEAIEAMVLKRPPVSQPEEVARTHIAQLRERQAQAPARSPLLHIAAENVTYAHFSSFFTRHYGYSAAEFSLSELPDGARRLSIGTAGAADFQIDLWPSEARTAPWEMLARGESLPDSPDVLLIPQVHLGSLGHRDGQDEPRLLDLSERRLRWPERTRPRVFDYGFLDRCYPGWRRWCTLGSRVMAAPFSVNTMLLCANDDLLPELCAPYWQSRSQAQTPGGGRFLPSSWSSLIEMLRQFGRLAPTDRDWEPFRMVLHERGLYYEWLNIVLALGGEDLKEGEGRLLESVRIADEEVINATELLRDLASTTAMKEVRMDDQIEAFGQGKLALYVAWTDSFRFEAAARKSGNGGPVEPSPRRGRPRPSRHRPGQLAGRRVCIVQVPGRRQPTEGLHLRLGLLPRDVNFPRKPVVDGWLMVFPATGDLERQSRALKFASAFLEPDTQLTLLRTGFPTASLWAVQRELENLGSAASDGDVEQHNYSVFLSLLRAAIVEGHWVPSPEKGQEINELIQKGLHEVLDGEAPAQVLAKTEEQIKAKIREQVGVS